MAYSAKGQKKYNANSTYFSIKYTPQEQEEGKRIKAYLAQTGQSANSYIKGLIRSDLDRKGFMMDADAMVDAETDIRQIRADKDAETGID